jgi:ParB family chromosome partitioning protein
MNDRLGRGLEALIRDIDEQQQTGTGITTLHINSIVPNRYQPRKSFDLEKLNELAESIKENGIIQPIVVTKTADNSYELIAGERRLEAAKLAGLSDVPVIIRCVSPKEQLQLAIIENIQRENLNAIEEAKAYLQLIQDFHMTHEQISQIMGKNRSTITNALRLLRLAEGIQEMISDGRLSSGHARAIMVVNEEYQLSFASFILENALSVRSAEEKAKTFPELKPTKPGKPAKNLLISSLEKQLSDVLNHKTKIDDKGGKGKVIIEYKSKEELEALTRKLSAT